MKKGQVIGLVVTALAVVGGVAVYNWVRKPRKNSDGFFNASGATSKRGEGGIRCQRPDGTYYSQPKGATTCVYSSDRIVSL